MFGIAGLEERAIGELMSAPKVFEKAFYASTQTAQRRYSRCLSKAKKRSVTDPEFAWWAEGNVLIRLQATASSVCGRIRLSRSTRPIRRRQPWAQTWGRQRISSPATSSGRTGDGFGDVQSGVDRGG